jgi:putative addiction module component (TIGR02574 family)
MSLTLDQIVEEARQLPHDTVAELVDRIMLAKYGVADEPLSPAWREVVHRRVEDIRSGREPGIDGEEVMARARKLVGR